MVGAEKGVAARAVAEKEVEVKAVVVKGAVATVVEAEGAEIPGLSRLLIYCTQARPQIHLQGSPPRAR